MLYLISSIEVAADPLNLFGLTRTHTPTQLCRRGPYPEIKTDYPLQLCPTPSPIANTTTTRAAVSVSKSLTVSVTVSESILYPPSSH